LQIHAAKLISMRHSGVAYLSISGYQGVSHNNAFAWVSFDPFSESISIQRRAECRYSQTNYSDILMSLPCSMNSLLSAKNGAGRRMEWHAPMIVQVFAARYTRIEVYMYVNGGDRITWSTLPRMAITLRL